MDSQTSSSVSSSLSARLPSPETFRLRLRFRKLLDRVASGLCFLAAAMVVLPLFLILAYLLVKGGGALNGDFLIHLPKPAGESGGGMANAMIGTLTLLGLALAIGIPVGVLGGVYMAEFGSPRFNTVLRFCGDLLNGVPSILWGIVVYGLMVLPMKGFSAWSGGVALGLLTIPILLRITEEVVRLVPGSYREAALALGISRWKVTVHIVLRTAMKGIVSGILLVTARIAGETAPLLFTAFGNQFWNHRLRDPIAALPLQIFSYAISPYDDWHRQAWAGALVLVGFVFMVNFGVRFLIRGGKS